MVTAARAAARLHARRLIAAGGVLAALAAGGCAVDPIDGYTWEEGSRVQRAVIKVTEVADVGPYCAKYFPGRITLACSVQHLDYCEIFVPPKSPAYIAHEAAHCLGYKHPGEKDITQWARGGRYAAETESTASAADGAPTLR